MEITLANLKDLKEIKKMYTDIIKNMYKNNITIWNKYYPNEVFKSDIEHKNLYLLKEKNIIVGCFALYEHSDIEEDIMWENKKEKAFLLTRVGVNIDYLHQGIGQNIVSSACKIAKEKDAKFLRLLVSDINIPAINLYSKCKLKKVEGIHEEKVRDDFSIKEYGFEILLA